MLEVLQKYHTVTKDSLYELVNAFSASKVRNWSTTVRNWKLNFNSYETGIELTLEHEIDNIQIGICVLFDSICQNIICCTDDKKRLIMLSPTADRTKIVLTDPKFIELNTLNYPIQEEQYFQFDTMYLLEEKEFYTKLVLECDSIPVDCTSYTIAFSVNDSTDIKLIDEVLDSDIMNRLLNNLDILKYVYKAAK